MERWPVLPSSHRCELGLDTGIDRQSGDFASKTRPFHGNQPRLKTWNRVSECRLTNVSKTTRPPALTGEATIPPAKPADARLMLSFENMEPSPGMPTC